MLKGTGCKVRPSAVTGRREASGLLKVTVSSAWFSFRDSGPFATFLQPELSALQGQKVPHSTGGGGGGAGGSSLPQLGGVLLGPG